MVRHYCCFPSPVLQERASKKEGYGGDYLGQGGGAGGTFRMGIYHDLIGWEKEKDRYGLKQSQSSRHH